MISRREFLRLGGTAAALALAPQAAVAAERLEVEEVEVSVPFLPRPFDFFRIGFLSDTHLGAYVPHEWIESAVRQLNEVQADLVVLGGDYIGYRDSLRSRRYGFSQNNCFDHCPVPLLPKRLLTATADLLGRLKASQGVHAVFGNHDEVVYPGIRDRIFAKRGINPLGNTVVSIRRDAATLQLIGTEDYRTGRPRLPSLPSSRGDNEVRILLTHNPDLLSDVLRNTQFQFDLGLAGHTHGGQVKLPLIGALKYNVRDEAFSEGLVARYGAQVYTTRGVGLVGLPLRLNCPAEVSVLTLRRA